MEIKIVLITKMLKGFLFGKKFKGDILSFEKGYTPSAPDRLVVCLENGNKLDAYCEGYIIGTELNLCKERLLQPLSAMHGRSLKWRKINMNTPIYLKVKNDFDLTIEDDTDLIFNLVSIRNAKKAV